MLPKIKIEKLCKLDKDVNSTEISNILFTKLNEGKSPGNDGLTVGFYKHFWPQIKSLVCDSILAGIEKGEMSATQKQSIIRLIRKKDKNACDISSWRPISLMNVDAKILSRLISARFEEVIEELLSVEQLAYISCRNIADGSRLIDYVINYHGKNNRGGYLLALDFKRAFDSIEHNFMYEVLHNFGFPDRILNLIKTLYKGAESAVMNNGFTTKYFPLLKSCRQGDCLSPYLFVLCLEPLLQQIKLDVQCRGIRVADEVFKLSVYADDITAFVESCQDGERLIEIVEDFGKWSGLKLNVKKSEIFPLGKFRNKCIEGERLKEFRKVDTVKITGIHFSHDIKVAEELNFRKPLQTMRTLATQFRSRDLSFIGKALVIKANLLSQFQYVANVLKVPKWVIREVDKIIFKFLWGGVDKISRPRAACNILQGGLGIPSGGDVALQSACKWLLRYFQVENLPWKKFMTIDIEKVGGICGISSLRKPQDVVKLGFDPFNEHVFHCWNALKEMNNEKRKLSNCVVWWNRQLEVSCKGRKTMLEGGRLKDKHYCRITDFVDQDGRIREAIGSLSLLEKMEWMTVYSRIKKLDILQKVQLKTTLDHNNLPVPQMISLNGIDIDCLSKKDLKATIRKFHRENSFVKPSKFYNQFGIEVQDLLDRMLYIKKISISSRFRNFIWRSLNGILYSNDQKFRFGYISEADSFCFQCKSVPDSLEHMYLGCNKVEELRAKVYTELGRNFSCKEALIGCGDIHVDFVLWKLNHYIYVTAIAKTKLSFHEFKAAMRMLFLVEEEIATKKGKLANHAAKWANLSRFSEL